MTSSQHIILAFIAYIHQIGHYSIAIMPEAADNLMQTACTHGHAQLTVETSLHDRPAMHCWGNSQEAAAFVAEAYLQFPDPPQCAETLGHCWQQSP